MNILFAGTPEFAVAPLRALAEKHKIVGVFTQPDRKAGRGKKLTPPPVKLVAAELGIPIFQPESLKEQASVISEMQADVMVVVAYGMLLPQAILDIPKFGCINIHASLLPRWRGAAPIQRAIEAGDKSTGVSIMRMELGLDTGPVFQVLETPITSQDTSATLHDRLATLGAQGICGTLDELTKHPELEPSRQDSSSANYAKKISKAEALLDWSESAANIDQKIRAFIPWPVCQTDHQGERIRIWQASIDMTDRAMSELNQAAAGEILDINSKHILVACGEYALRLEILQRAGSKALPIREFCNGYALKVGDRFDPVQRPVNN